MCAYLLFSSHLSLLYASRDSPFLWLILEGVITDLSGYAFSITRCVYIPNFRMVELEDRLLSELIMNGPDWMDVAICVESPLQAELIEECIDEICKVTKPFCRVLLKPLSGAAVTELLSPVAPWVLFSTSTPSFSQAFLPHPNCPSYASTYTYPHLSLSPARNSAQFPANSLWTGESVCVWRWKASHPLPTHRAACNTFPRQHTSKTPNSTPSFSKSLFFFFHWYLMLSQWANDANAAFPGTGTRQLAWPLQGWMWSFLLPPQIMLESRGAGMRSNLTHRKGVKKTMLTVMQTNCFPFTCVETKIAASP